MSMQSAASRILLAALVLVLSNCGDGGNRKTSSTESPTATASGTLTFGAVSLNPASEYETFLPFAQHVAAQMGEFGIGRGRVVVVDSMSKMVEELRSGTVDVFIDSPFPVGFVSTRTEIEVILRRWKRGTQVYRSAIFARSDGAVAAPDDLVGKMIAFGEPYSTSGFLLPKADLVAMDLRMTRFEDAAASVPPDRVGYVFSEDAETTMFWVLNEKVVAGAVNLDYYEDLAGSRIDELRLIHTSEEVPRNLVSVRGDLDRRIVEGLTTTLLNLGLSEAGRQVMENFEETSRFDEFPGGGELAIEKIIDLMQYVESDLGG